MAHYKLRTYFIVLAFMALISFQILNSLTNLVKDIESSENRKMAAKPEMKLSHLDPFPGLYEKYYNDNFSIRSVMVKYFNLLNVKVLKKSPIPDKVIIGKDDWLFMAGKELDAFTGKDHFTASELDAFRQELDYRKKYLEDRNCKFYFMIAPTKANIYPEKMPGLTSMFAGQSWGEQLNHYLDSTCTVKPVNVYDVLRAKKETEPVYSKLDNHWTPLGAFYCANEFLRRLQADFPGCELLLPDDFDLIKTETTKGNIVGMLSNVGGFKDTLVALVPKNGYAAKDVKAIGYPVVKGFPYPWEYEMDREIAGSDLPRILIISDSFGVNIFPYISERFSRTVKIFDSWQYKLNEDIVNSEKPDVVIIIALEANIKSMLNFQSRLKQE